MLRLTAFLVLLYALPATAQHRDRLAGYGIEVNPVYGKIIRHNYIFPPMPPHSYAVDIALLKRTDGSRDWQLRRKYPLLGLGITYTDYGLDSVYGKCIGLYPVWEIPIIRKNQLEWTCRFGYGIGYVTRRYERYPTWDTVNNLIGSHLNNFTMFTTQLRYKVSHRVHVHAGFNFSHISNGSFRLPNLGVNMYGGHVGMRYFPSTDEPLQKGGTPVQHSNPWMVQARVGMGMTEYNNVDGPRFPVYTATVFAAKKYGGRNKVLAGVDYSYFRAMYTFLRNNGIAPGEERSESWEGVIFVGHEFIIGRVGIIAQAGMPFKHTAINKDKTIQKLGYSYYILQHEQGILKELTLNGFIKSNDLEASHLEFGVGIGI